MYFTVELSRLYNNSEKLSHPTRFLVAWDGITSASSISSGFKIPFISRSS